MAYRRGGVSGPLGGFAPGFRTHLEGLGFAPASVRNRIIQWDSLGRWMEAEGLGVQDLTGDQAQRYLAARRADGRVAWVSTHCVELPLGYLRDIDAVPAHVQVVTDSLLEDVLREYRTYLVNERGLAAATVTAYVRIARSFCLSAAAGGDGPAHVVAADVTSFVVATYNQSSVALAKKTVTALASLLRYLHVSGLTTESLRSALPKVAGRGSDSAATDLDSAR